MLQLSRSPHAGPGLAVGAFGAAVWVQRAPRCHGWQVLRTRLTNDPGPCGDDWGFGPTGVRRPRTPLPRGGSDSIALDEPDHL